MVSPHGSFDVLPSDTNKWIIVLFSRMLGMMYLYVHMYTCTLLYIYVTVGNGFQLFCPIGGCYNIFPKTDFLGHHMDSQSNDLDKHPQVSAAMAQLPSSKRLHSYRKSLFE